MERFLVTSVVVLTLILVNYSIWKKEAILSEGKVIYLQLAPVDPRSIMQGDYMILRYGIPLAIASRIGSGAGRGLLLVTADENNVATISSVFKPGDNKPPGSLLLQYKVRKGRVRIGSDAYFFQEGHAKLYQHAKYGEIRVESSGQSVLVGLRDAEFNLLGPDKDRAHVIK